MMDNRIMLKNMNNDQGFTLLEFLVALAVGSIVTAVVYMAFTFQQRTWVTQDQMAAMQQSLRMSLRFIAKDIMLAGYDPHLTQEAKFIGSDTDPSKGSNNFQLEFTMDLGSNTSKAIGASDHDVDDPEEHIRYYLSDDGEICRMDLNLASPTCDVVAEDVEDLRFYYFLEDGTVTAMPAAGDMDYIRYVRVVILARTEGIVTQSWPSQTFTYINQDGFSDGSGVFNDNRRRLLLAMNVQCRNRGLL